MVAPQPPPSPSMDEDGEVELYLLLFPVSPLVLSQIKSSLWAFAYLSSSLMFAHGSAIVADCDAVEEAPPPRRGCLLAITRPSCTRLNTSKSKAYC